MAAESWCTIESDPGVFTELIQTIGVNGTQVEELYSLDDHEFEKCAPVYGLIFLFKWRSETDDRPTIHPDEEPGLFFANQVIPNACATQAILSVLLNTKDVDLGPVLSEFKSFTAEFSSDLKGLAISNSAPIRTSHNSFARAEPFIMEESKTATEKDDVFHFIAYLPFNGKVYELDGLKQGPVLLGEGSDWLSIARPAIQARIERYATSEIRFNLMAIIKNRKDKLLEQLAVQGAVKGLLESALAEGGEMMEGVDGFEMAEDAAGRQAQLQDVTAVVEDIQKSIEAEEEKMRNWHRENIRRKHNYIPLVVNLLKLLAKQGHLRPMLEKAQQARREAASKEAKS